MHRGADCRRRRRDRRGRGAAGPGARRHGSRGALGHDRAGESLHRRGAWRMLLTLDVGNTEITMGLFRSSELVAHWRMTTNPGRTPDEWGSAVSGFLLGAGHSPNEVRAVCLASVAPGVTQGLIAGIARATGCTGVQVDARSP